jgi:7,8-dihydropterin-6-yl-methyl-4-(beta-D-ribofuranosyl)aminobenzene 5'-phosphate synthase
MEVFMKIKATVLSENSVFSNLGAIAEHGWAVFLETEHGNFLFDTGQGKALLNNSKISTKICPLFRELSSAITILIIPVVFGMR